MTTVAVYTEDRMFSDVREVLLGLLKQNPEVDQFIEWNEVIDRSTPCLVLGKMPDIPPVTFVKTLSQKQIMVQGSALSELEVALKNLLQPPTFPPMEYRVVRSALSRAEEDAIGNTLIVDIETGGHFDLAIRPEEKSLLCVGINDGKNIYVYSEAALGEHAAGREQLKRILTKPGRKLGAHNMKFDFPILGVHLDLPKLTGHFDTMLLHHAINHGAKEHGLKPLAKKYLGAPEWEEDQHQYVKKAKDFSAIPRDVLYKYNAYDVYWTWHLYRYLIRVLKTEPERLGKLALHEYRMSGLFQQVEANGIAVDLPYLHELEVEYTASKAEKGDRLRELAGDEQFNPGSPKQVKEFFEEAGYSLKGTAEGIIAELDLAKDPTVQEFRDVLLDWRGDAKMLSTYVNGLTTRLRGNLVYPTFYVHGTVTGRLSSRDPNIQNIPRDKKLRKLFVPRSEGRTMVQVDYSQAELRVMACLSGDDYLQSLFQPDSPDFFDALMPVAYPGIELDTLPGGQRKNLRAKLKGVIYGMSYGRQAQAIAKSLDMPVQQAATIMSNYFQQAPDLYEWRAWVSEVAVDPDKTLVSPFGRQYQAELVTGRNRQNVINSALAFLPQSTASDMCVMAAINVQDRLRTGAYGDTMIVATIHDAILSDVPDEYVDSYAAMVEKEMEAAGAATFGNAVLFAAEASRGRSWGEAD